MKNFLLIFSLISCNYLQSQDGWIDQRKSINVALNACCFPVDSGSFNGHNYWIVGDSGYILKSSSHANGWSRLESCTSENLNGVYFFHNGTGFCVGDHGTIIKTEHFGNQWEFIPLEININLNDIWFISDSVAIIVGDEGLLLKSFDVGTTWAAISLNTTNNLNKIKQLTNSLIWIVGDDGTALKSVDGGNSWQSINIGYDNDFNDIYLPDNNCIYIVGDNGLVIKSENGGETWMDYSIPVNSDLYGVACPNCYSLYVCGDEGAIYSRKASDTAWIAYQGDVESLNFKSITMLPQDNYFLFTADSGNYLMQQGFSGYSYPIKACENIPYYDIEFLDPFNGFLSGNATTLLHTQDGGNNWFSLHFGDFHENDHGFAVMDVDFTSPSNGFALLTRHYYQDYSLILGTDDGGLTWSNYFYTENQRLTCMYFLDSLHGWVGAELGFIMNTYDGGLTWDTVQPTNQEMFDVEKIFFYTPQDGYIFRNYSEFYVTHDGGQTCTLTMDFGYGSGDFSAIQDSLIWFVSELAGVYKSIDGGNLWSYQLISFSDNNPYKICFVDDLEGWITGNRNSLWHTTDGGENWILENYDENGVNFIAMTFVNNHNGWLYAQDGAILHGPGLYAGEAESYPAVSNIISIFPNPSNSEVNFILNDNNFNEASELILHVYSMTGQQISTSNFNNISDNIKLNVSGFQPGIYLAVIQTDEMVIYYNKFVVTR